MKRVKRSILPLALALAVCWYAGCSFGKSAESAEEKAEKGQETSEQGGAAQGQTKDGPRYSFRTNDKKFQICTTNGEWEDIFPVGVNIGAGKPGHFPGEFAITEEEYLRWFQQIGEMNANTIRVYTILMPEFYKALAKYNESSEKPLYFMQGVYNNEEDIANLGDAFAENEKIAQDFSDMCQTIVDVVHGNAVIEKTPGNAGGAYTADVSQYLIGWIMGIEWQPDFVINTNENNPDRTSFDGKYVYTEEASPFEVFLAAGLEACISYETEHYQTQRPAAFANWVTTDPLAHPGEPAPDKEDAVSVDAEHIKAKPEFEAGFFASYHVYPYYPEMMRYAPELLTDDPQNPYKHYLSDLNKYHTMPVVVSEFGVPAARGITHLALKEDFNQGGLTEEQQGNALVSMLDDIIDTGCAGACIFIWQDEWFKRTWNTMDFTDPDARPYWCDVQTSEQFFGLLSFDPGAEAVCNVDGDPAEWDGDSPVLKSADTELYVRSDEAYLYLMKKGGSNKTRITLDTIENQGSKDFQGADFAIDLNGEENSRVQVDPYYDINYWLYAAGPYVSIKALEVQEGYAEKDNNTFAPIYLMLNRPVELSDGTTVGTEMAETGRLRHGNANPDSADYDSRADFCIKGDVTEIRLPWLLLNIPAPNAKKRIANLYEHDGITFEPIESITLAIDGVSGSYSWEGWELPTYRERLKQSYYMLQEYLSKI